MEITPLSKVLQLKCPLHPSNQSDILHIAAGAASHRACIKCVLSGDVPSLAALDLKSLFQMEDSEDSLISNYPPLGDPTLFKRLESIKWFSRRKTIDQIVQYIANLKQSFDEILEKFQKDSIKSVIELGQQRRQVLDLYYSLCEPNILKEAVIQAQESKEESTLHKVILNKYDKSTINTSRLQSVISQFEANLQKFSWKLVNESSETLRKISFFTSPITPLIYSQSILQEFELVPSNLFDSVSRTMISRKENNQIDAQCILNNGYVSMINSSHVLDNNTHYIFRFAFHQEATEGGPYFCIGLINAKDKDKEKTTASNGFGYSEHTQDCSINSIIKGQALNSALDTKNLHKKVEMRVHLASQTVKVADFPSYNDVVELSDKTKIREGCQYYLLVQLGYVSNRITLTDVIIANSFDSSM